MYFFSPIVLSPCAFIAGNYALLGRLSQHTGTGRYLIVRATLLTKLFVGSDIITFLIQATGGTMSISKNADSQKLGSNVSAIIIPGSRSGAAFSVCLS